MGFVVDKVALGQVSLRVVSLCQYYCTVALHAHILSGGRTIGPFVAAVQRHSLAPSTRHTKSYNVRNKRTSPRHKFETADKVRGMLAIVHFRIVYLHAFYQKTQRLKYPKA
jgi:hypothetical protein